MAAECPNEPFQRELLTAAEREELLAFPAEEAS